MVPKFRAGANRPGGALGEQIACYVPHASAVRAKKGPAGGAQHAGSRKPRSAWEHGGAAPAARPIIDRSGRDSSENASACQGRLLPAGQVLFLDPTRLVHEVSERARLVPFARRTVKSSACR